VAYDRSWHKTAEIRGKFLAIGMTASKAIAVMADSEYIASNSCYRNLTMILPVFFLERIQGEQEKN
jgi:hypothetical protein